jgi:hypothetical protein
MRTPLRIVAAAGLATLGLAGALSVPTAAQAGTAATDCTVFVSVVSYDAEQLTAGTSVEGSNCPGTGPVDVQLQISQSQNGPWTTVSEGPAWPSGTVVWDDVYGCGWYQAVGTYQGLTGKSPHPSYNC